MSRVLTCPEEPSCAHAAVLSCRGHDYNLGQSLGVLTSHTSHLAALTRANWPSGLVTPGSVSLSCKRLLLCASRVRPPRYFFLTGALLNFLYEKGNEARVRQVAFLSRSASGRLYAETLYWDPCLNPKKCETHRH